MNPEEDERPAFPHQISTKGSPTSFSREYPYLLSAILSQRDDRQRSLARYTSPGSSGASHDRRWTDRTRKGFGIRARCGWCRRPASSPRATFNPRLSRAFRMTHGVPLLLKWIARDSTVSSHAAVLLPLSRPCGLGRLRVCYLAAAPLSNLQHRDARIAATHTRGFPASETLNSLARGSSRPR